MHSLILWCTDWIWCDDLLLIFVLSWPQHENWKYHHLFLFLPQQENWKYQHFFLNFTTSSCCSSCSVNTQSLIHTFSTDDHSWKLKLQGPVMIMLPLHVLLELVEAAMTFSHSYFFPRWSYSQRRQFLWYLCLVNEVKLKYVLFSPFSDDEHYQWIKSAATVTGRGRPPNLLQKPLTNRLLLQLELLWLECKKSWDEISSFLPRVVDQESLQKFQAFNVKLEIEAAGKLAADQSPLTMRHQLSRTC